MFLGAEEGEKIPIVAQQHRCRPHEYTQDPGFLAVEKIAYRYTCVSTRSSRGWDVWFLPCIKDASCLSPLGACRSIFWVYKLKNLTITAKMTNFKPWLPLTCLKSRTTQDSAGVTLSFNVGDLCFYWCIRTKPFWRRVRSKDDQHAEEERIRCDFERCDRRRFVHVPVKHLK